MNWNPASIKGIMLLTLAVLSVQLTLAEDVNSSAQVGSPPHILNPEVYPGLGFPSSGISGTCQSSISITALSNPNNN